MPVNSQRKDYNAFVEKWSILRDCFGGRQTVLKAGHKYVPDLPGLDHLKNNEYRARGNFYNAVSRTVFGLVGAIFQKTPTFVIPTQFEDYLKDVTLSNVTMEMFALEASHETMLLGRYGALVDMAQPLDPTELMRPYIIGYEAEDIVNWRTERPNGDEILTLVVLQETYTEPDVKDAFIINTCTQYKVCQLIDGVYTIQLWRRKDNTGDYIAFGSPMVPIRRGVPLDFIPFIFIGTTKVTAELQQPPMLDLANVNLAHWRNSVDYEYGLHHVALPTPWVSGLKGDGGGAVPLGPSRLLELDVQGQAGMLEFSGAGLKSIYDAMEEKKKEMATLGARMLEAQEKLNETATAVLVRHSSDYANLRTIAQTAEQGFTMLLQIMCWWMGIEEDFTDVEAKVELNKEFMAIKVDPQTIQVALTAVQAGEMSFKTFYNILQTGGWARDGVDDEEERADIDAQAPPPTPEPTIVPGQPVGAAA